MRAIRNSKILILYNTPANYRHTQARTTTLQYLLHRQTLLTYLSPTSPTSVTPLTSSESLRNVWRYYTKTRLHVLQCLKSLTQNSHPSASPTEVWKVLCSRLAQVAKRRPLTVQEASCLRQRWAVDGCCVTLENTEAEVSLITAALGSCVDSCLTSGSGLEAFDVSEVLEVIAPLSEMIAIEELDVVTASAIAVGTWRSVRQRIIELNPAASILTPVTVARLGCLLIIDEKTTEGEKKEGRDLLERGNGAGAMDALSSYNGELDEGGRLGRRSVVGMIVYAAYLAEVRSVQGREGEEV